MATTLERVQSLVATQFGVSKETLKPETRFNEDLGADSLDQIEIVMELEEEFDITIADDIIEQVKTIADAAQQVDIALA